MQSPHCWRRSSRPGPPRSSNCSCSTDILVLQHFQPPEQIAHYHAVVKTLALVSFVYFAVAAASAHRFTEYHVAGDRERLAAFIGQAIRWTFWPSLATTVAILLAGKP